MKFFKQHEDQFVTHSINVLLLLLGILLIAWSVSVFVKGYVFDVQSLQQTIRTLAPVWLLLGLYWLSSAWVSVRIVPGGHEMIKGYLFGSYRKTFPLAAPLDLTVATTYKRGKRIESDVCVKAATGKMIKIRRFPKSDQIEPFIAEFKSLFGGVAPQGSPDQAASGDF